MRGEGKVQVALRMLLTSVNKLEKRQSMLKRCFEHVVLLNEKLEEEIEEVNERERNLKSVVADFQSSVDEYVDSKIRQSKAATEANERRLEKQLKRLTSENEELRASAAHVVDTQNAKEDLDHKHNLSRASTIAIYDSIIAAIGNWSNDGQTAPDFELLFQSIIFQLVYEPTMMGDSDYYVPIVPPCALEIVRRGREFVKSYRDVRNVFITDDEELWAEASSTILEWLSNDALPMIYGCGSDEWALTKPLSIKRMLQWRDEPASRVLEFPLIFDGMELIKKMGDDIRQESGLPEFTKQTLQTRIDP